MIVFILISTLVALTGGKIDYGKYNDAFTRVGNSLSTIDEGVKNGDAFAVSSGIFGLASHIPGRVGLLFSVASTLLNFFTGSADRQQKMIQNAFGRLSKAVAKLEEDVDRLEAQIEKTFQEIRLELRKVALNEVLLGIRAMQSLFNATTAYPSKALILDYVQTCRHSRVNYGPDGVAEFLLSESPGTLKEFLILQRPMGEYLRFVQMLILAYTHSVILFYSCSVLLCKLNGVNITAHNHAAFTMSINKTYSEMAQTIIYDTKKKAFLDMDRQIESMRLSEFSDPHLSVNDSVLPKGWKWFILMYNLPSSWAHNHYSSGGLTYVHRSYVEAIEGALEALSQSVWFFFKRSQFPMVYFTVALVQNLTDARSKKLEQARKCLYAVNETTCRRQIDIVKPCLDSIPLKYYVVWCDEYPSKTYKPTDAFVVYRYSHPYLVVIFLYEDELIVTEGSEEGMDYQTAFYTYFYAWI